MSGACRAASVREGILAEVLLPRIPGSGPTSSSSLSFFLSRAEAVTLRRHQQSSSLPPSQSMFLLLAPSS